MTTIDSATVKGTSPLPLFISVDDHVLEPADLWTSRLPAKYLDVGPRIVRQKGRFGKGRNGEQGPWFEDETGNWADVWLYEDLVKPLDRHYGAAGFDREALDWEAVTFEDLRPGCYQQAERLSDMDQNHTEVSICFPNTVPRFCGQQFAEAKDKDLALLCVQAYNDWMIDEWAAGPGKGRLIPLTLVPLWDPELARREVLRCAEKGSYAVTFSENPYALGLPSLYSGEWDLFLAACESSETTICLHIGSSSKMPTTAADAPYLVSSILLTANAAGSLLDFIFSKSLHKFPRLKLAYSETDIGWAPYLLQRMDLKWSSNGRDTEFGGDLPDLPSSYFKDRIYGCVIDDEVGMQMRSYVNNQICFETDYPHADTSWPHSEKVARTIIDACGLDDQETYDFLRGNAIRAFGLQRFGITS
jgi:predicted TIM-barrel fold metal-dependent hydrolase